MPLVKVESPILSGNINADDVIAFFAVECPVKLSEGAELLLRYNYDRSDY